MNPSTRPVSGATASMSAPELAARRNAANRRLGWSLAIFAVLLFLCTLFLHR